MKHYLKLLIILTCFTATTSQAESLMNFAANQPIFLEADEMIGSYGEERLEATGSAMLHQENLTMYADSIWFDKRKNEAGAVHNVSLTEKTGTLTGDDLVLNFTTGQARLSHAKAHLSEEGFNLSGEAIERIDEKSYRVIAGDFTACTADPPAWKFGASSVDVEVGGYARARNMIFYLHEIPVFYLPYFLYPVKTERESGLLIPHFGLSQLRGFETSLSYYQVLGRNMDATFLLNTYSRAGVGKGLEYRYILGDTNSGEIFLYHLTGIEGFKDVYTGHWQHAGVLPGEIRLRADLEYVSDRSYLKDFAVEAKDYNRERVESYLTLSRNWNKTDLSVQGEYISDLALQTENYPLSRLPSVHLSVMPQRIAATPLFLRLDTQANHLQQGKTTVGETLLLRPAARLALDPLSGVSLDLETGYRSLLTKTAEKTDDIGFFDFSSRLGTRLQRTYSGAEKYQSLRHDIEPEISYIHIGNGEQSNFAEMIPENIFLPTDRVIFGVTNRLTSRVIDTDGSANFIERLWLRLSSGYAISAGEVGTPESILPLRSEIILKMDDWLTLRADTSLGVATGDTGWKSIMSGVLLKDERRDELSLNYYYREEDVANYLTGRVQVPLSEHTHLGYEARYSAQGGELLEQRADIEYRGQCWSIIISYRDRPDDQEFLVNFTLAGLTSQGQR